MADKGINLRVAVNISARQLANQTIHPPETGSPGTNFEYCPIDVELTESCLISMIDWHCLLFNN
ncbi:hypothetical protein ACNKHT_08300 [Shigella flexneri]